MPCNIELYKDGGVLITSFCLEALYLIVTELLYGIIEKEKNGLWNYGSIKSNTIIKNLIIHSKSKWVKKIFLKMVINESMRDKATF